MAALTGIRVVDLSRYLAGPALTMLLADLGADVVKVEALPTGDPARQSGPFEKGESVYYLASNRNKRSIALDLREPAAMEAVQRLIASADVVVHNFKPGTAEKIGLGAEALHATNPRLVYVALSGFGQRPPGSELPGFDQTAQAMSGLMSVTGTESTGPLRVGIAVADSATGVFGAVGVLAALYEREKTGVGTVVETSLMQSMLTLMSYQAQKYLTLGIVPGLTGNDHPIMFPQGTFATADGAVTIACGNQRMWYQLCEVLGLEQLARDERFADNEARMRNRVELRAAMEAVLRRRPTREWLTLVSDAGIPCGPVLNVGEALTHPVTQGMKMVASVEHPTLGALDVLGRAIDLGDRDEEWLHRAPPLLGQHTRELLTEAGYRGDEIDALIGAGVAAEWTPPAQ